MNSSSLNTGEKVRFLNRLKKPKKRELKRFLKDNPVWELSEKVGISKYILYNRIREILKK